jgi:hypothetical protein
MEGVMLLQPVYGGVEKTSGERADIVETRTWKTYVDVWM